MPKHHVTRYVFRFFSLTLLLLSFSITALAQ